MAYARPSSQWLTATPFWRTLPADIGVVAYDVPMILGCADGKGLEISGWASHNSLAPPASHPGDLLAEVRRRFGEWPISPESYGPQSLDELLRLREHLLDNVGHSCDLALWLLQRPFDFAHRRLQRAAPRRAPAVGPLEHRRTGPGSARAGSSTAACASSTSPAIRPSGGCWRRFPTRRPSWCSRLHGMMANSARIDLLDAMLARVLGAANAGIHAAPRPDPPAWRSAAARPAPPSDPGGAGQRCAIAP